MEFRFLYQGLAEPVFTGEAPPAEDVTLDKWYRPLSVPAFPQAAVRLEWLAEPFPEVPSPDKWAGEPVLPIWLPVLRPLGDSVDPPVPLVFVDQWFVPLSQPSILPSYTHPGFSPITVGQIQPDIQVDQWFTPLSLPVFAAIPRQYIPHVAPVLPEITVDQWYVPLSQPQFIPQPARPGWYTQPYVREPSLDWLTQPEIPVRPPLPVWQGVSLHIEPPAATVFLDWMYPAQIPIPSAHPGWLWAVSAVEPPAVIIFLDWLPLLCQPLYSPPKLNPTLLGGHAHPWLRLDGFILFPAGEVYLPGIQAGHVFQPGIQTGTLYLPGLQRGDNYQPGLSAGDIFNPGLVQGQPPQ